MDTKLVACAVVGSTFSASGTAVSVQSGNEVLTTISIILTIIGVIISYIILPLINWYKRSKADGKIDAKEVKEGIEIINDGVAHVVDEVDKNKKGE